LLTGSDIRTVKRISVAGGKNKTAKMSRSLSAREFAA